MQTRALPDHRPLSWFGPDDYDGTGDPAHDAARRDLEIAAWDKHRDELLAKMNWFQFAFHYIFTPRDKLPL